MLAVTALSFFVVAHTLGQGLTGNAPDSTIVGQLQKVQKQRKEWDAHFAHLKQCCLRPATAEDYRAWLAAHRRAQQELKQEHIRSYQRQHSFCGRYAPEVLYDACQNVAQWITRMRQRWAGQEAVSEAENAFVLRWMGLRTPNYEQTGERFNKNNTWFVATVPTLEMKPAPVLTSVAIILPRGSNSRGETGDAQLYRTDGGTVGDWLGLSERVPLFKDAQ